jgi:hypothetical protein
MRRATAAAVACALLAWAAAAAPTPAGGCDPARGRGMAHGSPCVSDTAGWNRHARHLGQAAPQTSRTLPAALVLHPFLVPPVPIAHALSPPRPAPPPRAEKPPLPPGAVAVPLKDLIAKSEAPGNLSRATRRATPRSRQRPQPAAPAAGSACNQQRLRPSARPVTHPHYRLAPPSPRSVAQGPPVTTQPWPPTCPRRGPGAWAAAAACSRMWTPPASPSPTASAAASSVRAPPCTQTLY